MRTAGIREARQGLSILLEDVRNGREIVITDRGKPVARLVPPLPPSAKAFAGRGDLRKRMPILRPPLSHRLVRIAGGRRASRPLVPDWTKGIAGPVYLDASALASLYFPEAGSDALDAALRGRRDLTVSDLALTEIVAAFAGGQRATLETALARVRLVLLADLEAGIYRHAEIVPATHRAAERLLLSARPAMGAADALHLALAMTAGVATFLTFDPRRAAAARGLGLGILP